MFGIKPRGVKDFEKCQVRTDVTSEPHNLAYGLLSMNSFFGWTAAKQNPNMEYPRVATFNCPKLGNPEHVITGSVEGVKAKVAEVVGPTSCRDCLFANKTPDEVRVQLESIAEMRKAAVDERIAAEAEAAIERFTRPQ